MVDIRFENRRSPLLSRGDYLRRQTVFAAVAASMLLASLAAGMAGYHFLEDLPWVDSFVNAAMLLGGMGPVGELHTTPGKLFAGLYALYCGVIFLISVGLLMAPLAHRLLHRFHIEAEDDPDAPKAAPPAAQPPQSAAGQP